MLSLRHDKALHTVKLSDHLADVPDYIVPSSLREVVATKIVRKAPKEKLKLKQGKNRAFRKYVVSVGCFIAKSLFSSRFNE